MPHLQARQANPGLVGLLNQDVKPNRSLVELLHQDVKPDGLRLASTATPCSAGWIVRATCPYPTGADRAAVDSLRRKARVCSST